jgi:hypothetical protein
MCRAVVQNAAALHQTSATAAEPFLQAGSRYLLPACHTNSCASSNNSSSNDSQQLFRTVCADATATQHCIAAGK